MSSANEDAKGTAGGPEKAARKARRTWYDESHRDIVVYYLIAVFFLELVVGAIAFFYGVVHAEHVVEGGPRMARFPWVGWLVAAVLSPVGLLALLHMSGQFFSRTLDGQSGGGGGGSDEDVVPARLRRFYAIVRHAPMIVVLLGILAMGCAVLFVDSAMEMVMAAGGALRPYIPWILGGILTFLVLCYLGRLFFLARHREKEREYAYRMKVLETTGIVIMNKGCVPLRYEDGKLQLLESQGDKVMALGPGQGGDADVEDAAVVGEAAPEEPAAGPEAAAGADAVPEVEAEEVPEAEPGAAGR